MQKWLLLVGLGVLLFLAGCISNQPVCGNDSCESGENETDCPNDCATNGEDKQAQATECSNLLQIEALKLKNAIEQAVSGEVSQVEINQPACAKKAMRLKSVEGEAQCQADCQTAANRCWKIIYSENKSVCLENMPAYAVFLTKSPCENIANTILTDFALEIPNGKIVLTNASTADSQIPKLCAYKNTGLSDNQIKELFVPAKMKWIIEEKRKEALQTIAQSIAEETDDWFNSPGNWVAIPSGSEGKHWKEILTDFAKIQFGGDQVAPYFSKQAGIVRVGIEKNYSVRSEEIRNEQFKASAKIVTKENCGPQSPEACLQYHIEYSFSNANQGPRITVEEIEGQRRTYQEPLYSDSGPLKAYPQSDFVKQLAELVAQSQ